ncbi:MAG: pilus assembly protein PilM, partial [Paramuribaculum sp.]|nr:pilus assembly protein PilM [Paramuribaculum sp.]
MDKKHIIAIEIGSSKVKGAVGLVDESTGVIEILSVEEEPMLNWVRYGAVSNVEELSKLINRIIRKIENRVSPRKIAKVYVAIGGRSVCSTEKSVERRLAEEMEITDEVIDSMVREVAVSPFPDRDLLAVEPREFSVNRQVVTQPKGTVGSHVKMVANLITSRQATKRNLDLLFKDKLKLKVAGYQVRQLALADVVLSPEEKRLGCMLVDFGAETTTVSIYRFGKLCYLVTLPMGSRNITRDLMQLNYLEEHAESQKRKLGNVLGTPSTPGVSPSPESVSINNYVMQRAGEIIANIKHQKKCAGVTSSDLPAGIVIVGRGSLLAGFNERLAQVTALRVRVGSVNADGLLRIADSRISPVDSSDVISVLLQAARNGAEECLMELPQVVIPQPEQKFDVPPVKPETKKEEPLRQPVIPIVEDDEPEQDDDPQPERRRRSWFDRIKKSITNIAMEAEDA